MGLFQASSPFDADIEKATSEKNTTDQWGIIMDICDRVGTGSVNAKECLRSVMRRLNHHDPHVVIQAITLLDACASNCGRNFHLEVASREFENEFKKILGKSQPTVAVALKKLLKKWADGEFKSDPQLNLIPSLYQKLRSDGHEFNEKSTSSPKTTVSTSSDTTTVSSQQEAEDIAKAIQLSLKDKGGAPSSSGAIANPQSLYPSMSLTGVSASSSAPPATESRKVRALYDFEAAEDNELTFLAGEIIHVVDDSDPNWWKGYNQRGEGLFPSNFVTADLSVEPESVRLDNKSKKNVQFSEDVKEKMELRTEPIEINEEKIDRLLHLLHEANPEDPSQDTEEMLVLENQVNQMGPLIDAELERVDRKHAQLTQLSSDLVEAINLYHTLMRDPERPLTGFMNYPPQQQIYGQPNRSMPPMNAPTVPYAGMSQMYQHMMPSAGGPQSLPVMPGMMSTDGQHQSLSQPHQAGHLQMSGASQVIPDMSNYMIQNQHGVPSQIQNGHGIVPNQQLPSINGIPNQQQTQGIPPTGMINPQQRSANNLQPQLQQQPRQMQMNAGQMHQQQQQQQQHQILPPGHNYPPPGHPQTAQQHHTQIQPQSPHFPGQMPIGNGQQMQMIGTLPPAGNNGMQSGVHPQIAAGSFGHHMSMVANQQPGMVRMPPIGQQGGGMPMLAGAEMKQGIPLYNQQTQQQR